MSQRFRRPRLMLVAVFLLGALLAGSGVVVAAQVIKTGKAVTAVKVVTETSQSSASTPFTWTDVVGMSTSVNVPSGEQAILLITFSAQTNCTDGTGATTYCQIRVLVDGNAAPPGIVTFDSAADGNAAIAGETNSMQFVAGPLNAGSHTIKVQGLVDEAQSTFVLGAARSASCARGCRRGRLLRDATLADDPEAPGHLAHRHLSRCHGFPAVTRLPTFARSDCRNANRFQTRTPGS